ncbi:hypothetical protein [Streptacidiphilus sp. EB129]|uniref:hypothetical protein n=1 Tax=Streptacidiphilus sp. EB129 TaxID=3156262 RepID=UPI00351977AE
MGLRRTVLRRCGSLLVAALAGSGLLLAAAPAASAAARHSPVHTTRARSCGVDAGRLGRPPLTLRLERLHRVYRVRGSGWSAFRLTAADRPGVRCAGVRPVLVFGTKAGGLRTGEVRLEWRRGGRHGRWVPVPMVEGEGALAGQVGPARGLAPAAGGRVSVLLRMRFGAGAPPGRWLTMAVGYERVRLAGVMVPLPVGITDPHYFRLRRQ